MKKHIIFFIMLLNFPLQSQAWFSAGHRIVAAIAYENLTPTVKSEIDDLTRTMFYAKNGESRFLQSSTWADKIKAEDVSAFNAWHYIDLPDSQNTISPPLLNPENVAWAVRKSIPVLTSYKANETEKVLFLNFLIHFVGDAHQPMHCIARYNASFPQGDRGGNLVFISYPNITNLHAFWDSVGGLFPNTLRIRNRQVEKIARQMEHEYPKNYFANKIRDQDPWHWVKQSYALAVKYAYNDAALASNPLPTQYIYQTQTISQQQLVLAGYRLAYLLNSVLH